MLRMILLPRKRGRLLGTLQQILKPIQYHARKLRFLHKRVILGTSIRVENLHMICRHTEACILLRNVVRDDKVEILLRKFPTCVFRDVLRLRRKPHEDLMSLFLSKLIEDIGVTGKRERQFPIGLLDLVRGDLCGTIVCDRRRLDDRIHTVILCKYCCVHIACAPHIHAPHAHRCDERGRSRNEHDLCPAPCRLGSHRKAHAPR